MINLVIGTPMYGGQCNSEYVNSILQLTDHIRKTGGQCTNIFLGNESLIQRGRNTIAWHFLNSTNATHLLFADSDIKFKVEDIIKMIQSDKSVIIAPVAMKGINWENIRQASLEGKSDLWNYGSIFNIGFGDEKITDSNTPIKINHGGTALMLISRKAFEELMPHTDYYTNGGTSIPENSKVYDFFRVENQNHTLYSEDYYFCKSYRDLGKDVWLASWAKTVHVGSYPYV